MSTANPVPITVLLLIFFSGFLISPPDIVALSSPTNDHSVIAIAAGSAPKLFASSDTEVVRFAASDPIHAIIIKTKITPILITVVIILT